MRLPCVLLRRPGFPVAAAGAGSRLAVWPGALMQRLLRGRRSLRRHLLRRLAPLLGGARLRSPLLAGCPAGTLGQEDMPLLGLGRCCSAGSRLSRGQPRWPAGHRRRLIGIGSAIGCCAAELNVRGALPGTTAVQLHVAYAHLNSAPVGISPCTVPQPDSKLTTQRQQHQDRMTDLTGLECILSYVAQCLISMY